MIVHGAAAGVDTAFGDAAQRAGLSVEPHEVSGVDWKYYGKRAGPLRNAKMVRLGADLCIAVTVTWRAVLAPRIAQRERLRRASRECDA